MKRILIIVMLTIGCLTNWPSYALKIFDTLILDQEFYENNQSILPAESKIAKLEYPAWLMYEPKKIDFNANYSGIINIRNNNWKNTRAYNFNERIFFVYNTGKKFGFLEENTFAFYSFHEKFVSNIVNPKYNLDIHYQMNLVNPKIAWNCKVFRYLNIGMSAGYYNNIITPKNSLVDYGLEISFRPEFWKYGKKTTIGFRKITDYFSAEMLSYLFIKDWDFLKLKWLSKYVKRKNEFYIIRNFQLDYKHELISKISYSLTQPEEFRTSLNYNWNKKIELYLLANIRKDTENGPINLIDYSVPNEYESFVNDLSGSIKLNYENEKYGLKTATYLTPKNKIGISFLRDVFQINSFGESQTEFLKIEPFKFSQNLKIVQDQLQVYYLYQSPKWKINPAIKHISIYNKNGEITYWQIFQEEEKEPIKFDNLKLLAASLNMERHFRKFDIKFAVEQYIPLPKKNKKTTEKTVSSPDFENHYLLPKSNYKETVSFIKDNWLKTGFIGSISFVYYF